MPLRIYFIIFVQTLLQMNAIVWIPILISLSVVIGGLLLNAFIAGKNFEKKVDRSEFEERIKEKADSDDLIALENRFINRMERYEIVNAEVIRTIKKDISEQRKETTELYKKIIEIVQSK